MTAPAANERLAVWPAGPAASTAFRSMDGACNVSGSLLRPDRYAFFRGPFRAETPSIPRGAGLSFCGASFGPDVASVEMTSLDRLIDFDAASGLVRVEAGIRLSNLLAFLAPRRRILSVVPGYGSITVGGCIGADVHGKNPARDGTFISQVAQLRLFHPDHGIVTLAPDQEPQVFRATCGGFGLTGVIIDATLRTSPLPGFSVVVEPRPVADVAAAAAVLSDLAPVSDFTSAWHDFATPGRQFGRGHVSAIRFLADDADGTTGSFQPPRRGALSPDGALPVAMINRLTIRAMNALYTLGNRHPRQEPLARSVFPIHGKELYFRLFGRAGFHEYQALLPPAAVGEYVQRMEAAAQRHGTVITLGVTKIFGGTTDLLRFAGAGVSLAIELRRDATSGRFLAELDEALVAADGRPNIIKDSRLPREIVERTVPELDRFRAILHGWDPRRRFRSELSDRLCL